MSEDKQMLSLVLSVGLSEKRAKFIVDELYDKFDSLYSIINADEKSLASVDGIGRHKIKLLKSLPKLLEYYSLSVLKNSLLPFKMVDLVNYLSVTTRGLKFEVFSLACIDIKKRFLGIKRISKGSINTATIYPRDVIECVISMNASYVVFSHNHPSGIADPSQQDIEITEHLYRALYDIGVKVLDHIIIGGNTKYSFRDEGIIDTFKDNLTK